GVPVRCAVVSRTAIVSQGRPTGNEKFVFRVPAAAANGAEVQATYQLRTKNSDVVTLDGGSSVLALVPPGAPAEAILLLRDYYPLALGSSERRQAETAVSTDRG